MIASNTFKAKAKEFLTALGGINVSNIFFTFIAFFTLEKTRSGAAAAISQILATPTLYDLMLIMGVGLVATFIAAIVTLKAGRLIIRKIQNINYQKINISVLVLLVALAFMFSGFIGLLILATGVFIGILANSLKIRRSNMMGFFLLPTILYFARLAPAFSLATGL